MDFLPASSLIGLILDLVWLVLQGCDELLSFSKLTKLVWSWFDILGLLDTYILGRFVVWKL